MPLQCWPMLSVKNLCVCVKAHFTLNIHTYHNVCYVKFVCVKVSVFTVVAPMGRGKGEVSWAHDRFKNVAIESSELTKLAAGGRIPDTNAKHQNDLIYTTLLP